MMICHFLSQPLLMRRPSWRKKKPFSKGALHAYAGSCKGVFRAVLLRERSCSLSQLSLRAIAVDDGVEVLLDGFVKGFLRGSLKVERRRRWRPGEDARRPIVRWIRIAHDGDMHAVFKGALDHKLRPQQVAPRRLARIVLSGKAAGVNSHWFPVWRRVDKMLRPRSAPLAGGT